ncbi:MAG: class I SAM-dependent methyltransferase [Opitutaceae bacterium]|nr:class I SAM-dependent methyltransferase [Opitutaceae bacterium]
MTVFAKLLHGSDPARRSRFHTAEGARPDLAAVFGLPRSAVSTLWFRLTGRRPIVPWIPYNARQALARHICPDWQVLEIGSGMSTLWLARRCRQVDSFEADPDWVQKIRAELQRLGLPNVRVHYRWHWQELCDFSAWPDESLDLLVVDGGPRPECIEAGFPKVKPGGYIYVDNTDQPRTAGRSKSVLIELARQPGARLWTFRDFVPCNFFVNEALLYQKPSG